LNIVKFRSGLTRPNTAKFGLVPTQPNFDHDQLDWIWPNLGQDQLA